MHPIATARSSTPSRLLSRASSACLGAFVVATVFAAPTRAQTVDKALAAFKAGDWKQVFAAVTAVPADAEDRPRALYVAGEAYLVVGQPIEAESCFRRVLEKRAGAIPAKVGLGRALAAQEKFEDAQKILDDALAADAKDPSIRQALGELHLRAKKLDLARTELAQAYALDPRSTLIARSYCDALWAANDDDSAAKVAAQIAKSMPKHPLGPFLQAIAQERTGKDEKAIDLYEAALKLDPDYLDAHKNLAILCHTRNPMYTDAKRTRMALDHYAAYFALGGNDPVLRQTYDQFKSFMDAYAPAPKSKPDGKNEKPKQKS